MDSALIATLARIAALLAEARAPWWVIGSAAVALHGAPVAVMRDVDVLVDPGDMVLLERAAGITAQPGRADDRFRSDRLLRIEDGPLAIEAFAGFHVCQPDGGWRALRPVTREARAVGTARLFVPSRTELIAILHLFGRPKDLVRADLLVRG